MDMLTSQMARVNERREGMREKSKSLNDIRKERKEEVESDGIADGRRKKWFSR